MTRSYLLAAAALLLCTGSGLCAQTRPATPSSTTVPELPTSAKDAPAASEPEYEAFEFDEAELPQYDEAELVRLIHYPDEAKRNNIQGMVLVQFVIATDGRAEKVEIAMSDNAIFNEAAIYAISNMHFTPAQQRGKPVRVRMTIPIRFALQ